jgi:signal transduction histidine kinase
MHASETLQQTADKEDLESLATIDAQVKVMNVIVNDALDLSKIEAGRMTFETIGFSMGRLLRAVVTSLKSRSISQGITLNLTLAPDVAPWAFGDPTRIRQVIMNLLTK